MTGDQLGSIAFYLFLAAMAYGLLRYITRKRKYRATVMEKKLYCPAVRKGDKMLLPFLFNDGFIGNVRTTAHVDYSGPILWLKSSDGVLEPYPVEQDLYELLDVGDTLEITIKGEEMKFELV